MVDEPDVPTIFRNAFEERAPQIVALLDAEVPPRFGHLRSFDYSDPARMVFTGFEVAGGKPMVFILTLAKNSEAYVERELTKTITTFDRAK